MILELGWILHGSDWQTESMYYFFICITLELIHRLTHNAFIAVMAVIVGRRLVMDLADKMKLGNIT